MPEQTLLIRADASSEMGTGHVMRMIALAQAWQDRGGRVVIATCHCPEGLVSRLEEEGVLHRCISDAEVGSGEDSKATLSLANELQCRWIVVDGYHFDAHYQREIRNAGFKLLAVDDYGHCDGWCADAILNQNIFAPNCTYKSEAPHCRLMLGTKFALLRREFVELERQPKQKCERIERLLVTLGGADPENVTGKILTLLAQVDHPRLEVRVLVGTANPHRKNLNVQARQSKHHVQILSYVHDMPSQYLWADAVISAAGSTCWEWLYHQLPAAVVTIADNQRPIAKALRERELAVDLGWHEQLVSDCTVSLLLAFLSSCDQDDCHRDPIVDGSGASRVSCYLQDSDNVSSHSLEATGQAACAQ